MASTWGSPMGIIAIIMIILGIILAIVGVILLINYQNQTIPWWTWTMLIAGIIIAVIGGILLAMALSNKKKKTIVYGKKDNCQEDYRPMNLVCDDRFSELTEDDVLETDFSL